MCFNEPVLMGNCIDTANMIPPFCIWNFTVQYLVWNQISYYYLRKDNKKSERLIKLNEIKCPVPELRLVPAPWPVIGWPMMITLKPQSADWIAMAVSIRWPTGAWFQFIHLIQQQQQQPQQQRQQQQKKIVISLADHWNQIKCLTGR